MAFNYDYFISYAHADNESGFVSEFVEKLRANEEHRKMFGGEVRVAFDLDMLQGMDDWDLRIREKLASSRFFIVMLSPNYFKSPYCAREFEWWLAHEMHRYVLGEGTAPLRIVKVDALYDFGADTLPAMDPELRAQYPHWVAQLRKYQSNADFDLCDLQRAKIDETLRALKSSVEDRVERQNRAGDSRTNANYPHYNENFVGRRENLQALRRCLVQESQAAISAVHGLGGIGKTELALTYGHAFAWDYQIGRVFVHCEGQTSLGHVLLASGIAQMRKIKLEPGTESQQLTELFTQLNSRRETIVEENQAQNVDVNRGAHLFVILDNVDCVELVSQQNLAILPDFFHVIVTSREAENKFSHMHTESVDKLGEEESVELLNNLRPYGSDPAEAEAARKIARLLDGFTLAVELTGAYLRCQKHVTYQKHFARLKNDYGTVFEKIVATDGVSLKRHQVERIAAVLEPTLAALPPDARKLLHFASLFPCDTIPLTWLGELADLNEDGTADALAQLTNYCLLTPLHNQSNLARLHRLVLREITLPPDFTEPAKGTIRDKFASVLKEDASRWQQDSSHDWELLVMETYCHERVKAYLQAPTETLPPEMTRIEGFLDSLFHIERNRGGLIAAEQCAVTGLSLAQSQNASGEEIQATLAKWLNNLGNLHRVNGRPDLAEAEYAEALAIYRELVATNQGAYRPDVAMTLNNLGVLHTKNGRPDLAEAEWSEALAIYRYLAAKFPNAYERYVTMVQNNLEILRKKKN